MPSPFPGMDPYLEGYLWPDVHQSLASQLKRQLGPLLGERYVARLGVYFVNDLVPVEEIGIVYPDVEVVEPWPAPSGPSSTAVAETAPALAVTAPALVVPTAIPVRVRLTRLEVHDSADNTLVTSIKILSPVNKRRPGLDAYRRKRVDLIQAGVHLVEIDLIRRGERPWLPAGDVPPSCSYLAVVTRGGQARAEVWPITLQSPLPVLPVPLRPPDSDVPLDLQTALAIVYAESRYERTLDYRKPPPPPAFGAGDAAWIEGRLHGAGFSAGA